MPFSAFSLDRWARFRAVSSEHKNFGASIASPVERKAKAFRPISIPTSSLAWGNGWGSNSQVTVANHLAVLVSTEYLIIDLLDRINATMDDKLYV